MNRKNLSDASLLSRALRMNDAAELLDFAITALYDRKMNPRLADWLAARLVRVQGGESCAKVFALARPEGAPKGTHGSGRYDADSIAALAVLAIRRFSKRGQAYAEVAKAVGWRDPARVRRHLHEGDYGWLSELKDEDLLLAMAGNELLRRIVLPG